MSEIWNKLKDSAGNAFSESIEKQRQEIQRKQNERIVEECVSVLCDAGVKTDTITKIIIDRFGRTKDDVLELIKNERKINIPCNKIEKYLIDEFLFSRKEASEYIISNGIPYALGESIDLWKKEPKAILKQLGLKVKAQLG